MAGPQQHARPRAQPLNPQSCAHPSAPPHSPKPQCAILQNFADLVTRELETSVAVARQRREAEGVAAAAAAAAADFDEAIRNCVLCVDADGGAEGWRVTHASAAAGQLAGARGDGVCGVADAPPLPDAAPSWPHHDHLTPMHHHRRRAGVPAMELTGAPLWSMFTPPWADGPAASAALPSGVGTGPGGARGPHTLAAAHAAAGAGKAFVLSGVGVACAPPGTRPATFPGELVDLVFRWGAGGGVGLGREGGGVGGLGFRARGRWGWGIRV
jgi:hypothetical protein